VDLTGASIVDGSGLSTGDALRCGTLVDVLELTRRPALRTIREGLSVAGERGTLAPRLRGTPLAGNLRAKTGTLDGVSALAGFVDADRQLTFALLVNGSFGESTAFSLRETMAGIIQGYPGIADPATLVPAPKAPIPPRACPSAEAAC
jgi:serine-type D-Ala-D-Ala carboxypeptidase/endopeptidase (penicillin-binding protein 4)